MGPVYGGVQKARGTVRQSLFFQSLPLDDSVIQSLQTRQAVK
ncbi:hypothetical protein DEDE109153_01875 [Deinococcus deserti]